MLCPACKIEMLILEHKDIEIDFCHNCRGIWLDEGELELLLEGPEKEKSEIHKILLETVNKKTSGKRPCPVCSRKMIRTDICATPPIEIDKCPRNHGLWFDKGELEQVASLASAEPVVDFLKNTFRH